VYWVLIDRLALTCRLAQSQVPSRHLGPTMIPEQVDGDPEQPRADISTTRIEGAALRKSHGEGLCGQILGSRCPDLAFEKAVDAAKVTVEDNSEPRRFLE
jgi:hypothetical protein